MHQKLTRTGDFRFFMRTHLISRRKARIAEKQLPVAHIHMRQIDRGATSSDTLDFPATQLQPCLETLLDRVVESARLLRMSGVALFLFLPFRLCFFFPFWMRRNSTKPTRTTVLFRTSKSIESVCQFIRFPRNSKTLSVFLISAKTSRNANTLDR